MYCIIVYTVLKWIYRAVPGEWQEAKSMSKVNISKIFHFVFSLLFF